MKKLWNLRKSKTALFGLTVALLGIVEQNATLIPEQYRGLVLLMIGLASVVLRFVTTQPLEDK